MHQIEVKFMSSYSLESSLVLFLKDMSFDLIDHDDFRIDPFEIAPWQLKHHPPCCYGYYPRPSLNIPLIEQIFSF